MKNDVTLFNTAKTDGMLLVHESCVSPFEKVTVNALLAGTGYRTLINPETNQLNLFWLQPDARDF